MKTAGVFFELLEYCLIVTYIAATTGSVLAADRPALAVPLDEGAVWSYDGTAHWWDTTTAKVPGTQTSRIRGWHMKVLKTVYRGDVSASIVEGFPADLAWYGYDLNASSPLRWKVPGPTLIVQDADGLFVKSIDDGESTQLLEAAVGHQLAWNTDEDEIARFPVHVGDCTSTDPDARKYHMWSWCVTATLKTRFGSGWQIEYRSNTDLQKLDVVPGVGITRYVYHHNGTVADTDVHLTRYRR